MGNVTPFSRLTGPVRIYTHAASTAIPNLDANPTSSGWTELGVTDGDQSINQIGALTPFSNNDATGPVKHVRPEEGLSVVAVLTALTLEHRATITSMLAAAVTTTTSGALAVKELASRRGFMPVRYALLIRGGTVADEDLSAYGAWPGQYWIPLGVFDGEPQETHSKGGSPGLEFTYLAEWDSTQSGGREFGIFQMQSS